MDGETVESAYLARPRGALDEGHLSRQGGMEGLQLRLRVRATGAKLTSVMSSLLKIDAKMHSIIIMRSTIPENRVLCRKVSILVDENTVEGGQSERAGKSV